MKITLHMKSPEFFPASRPEFCCDSLATQWSRGTLYWDEELQKLLFRGFSQLPIGADHVVLSEPRFCMFCGNDIEISKAEFIHVDSDQIMDSIRS
jgi:hypothetical protein